MNMIKSNNRLFARIQVMNEQNDFQYTFTEEEILAKLIEGAENKSKHRNGLIDLDTKLVLPNGRKVIVTGFNFVYTGLKGEMFEVGLPSTIIGDEQASNIDLRIFTKEI